MYLFGLLYFTLKVVSTSGTHEELKYSGFTLMRGRDS